MALMKTLILALCIGHSAVLELPHRRRATVRHGPRCRCPKARQRKNAFCCSFIYWWRYMWWTHPSLGSAGFRRGAYIYTNAVPANRNPFQDFYKPNRFYHSSRGKILERYGNDRTGPLVRTIKILKRISICWDCICICAPRRNPAEPSDGWVHLMYLHQ